VAGIENSRIKEGGIYGKYKGYDRFSVCL